MHLTNPWNVTDESDGQPEDPDLVVGLYCEGEWAEQRRRELAAENLVAEPERLAGVR
jgi:hypothetical protein